MSANSPAKRIPYLALFMLAAIGCISGSGEGSAQPELQPISIGIAIPSYVHAVAWIADEKSYFEQEGLNANVQVMGGSSAKPRRKMFLERPPSKQPPTWDELLA